MAREASGCAPANQATVGSLAKRVGPLQSSGPAFEDIGLQAPREKLRMVCLNWFANCEPRD